MSDRATMIDASGRALPLWNRHVHRLALAIQCFAALLGAAGVVTAAAAAHRGGGELASTAAIFMLIHATAAIALSVPRNIEPRPGLALAGASLLLVIGTALFSGDLALAGLANVRPLPIAAPVGGTLMIAGWLFAAGTFAVAFFRRGTIGSD